MTSPVHVVVLAAGEGKRLRGAQPKVLTPLWGRPSVAWPVHAALGLKPERVVVVAGAAEEALRKALAGLDVTVVRQHDPKGTGHAVLAASEALAGATGRLLVLYGDCPLVTPALIAALVAEHERSGASLTLVSTELDDPSGYGRVLRDAAGAVTAIVEHKDASPAQRAVCEVNTGVYLLELPAALERLARVGTDNAQGEIYLTDLVGLASQAGEAVSALLWQRSDDVLGFNDQRELAVVRDVLRRRILDGHLANSVEIVDPSTTYIDAAVEIEPGARILPCTMIEGRCRIATGAQVGPFSHLRDGSVLGKDSRVGNFVETKKTELGEGAKAGHLTYLGDATVGAGANIGAGTITANYDGVRKSETHIGAGAFIGSGSVLVAPSRVGDGATTGAGAILLRHSEVGPGEVWVGVPARPLRSRPDADRPSDEEHSRP